MWKVANNLTGKRFNKLVAIKKIGSNKHKKVIWLFKCDCGNEVEVVGSSVVSGNTTSCGCVHKQAIQQVGINYGKYNLPDTTTHGATKGGKWTGTYRSYVSMKDRCLNTNHISYSYYGNRGIKICQRWLESFENFLEDMGERPKGKTLDRIDPDKDYEPNNCRWATKKQQANNRRNRLC